MLMTSLRRTALQRVVVILLLLMMSLIHGITPLAQAATPVWQICTPPPVCFASKEARQAWAEANHCRFIEDVCDKTPPDADNKGASAADQGFWGSAWGEVKGGLVYGYEFVKGLLTGLKDQIGDLLSLIVHVDDVVLGLIDLGRAFYNDPQGTLLKLAELLGQEAIDAITRATRCGAYDMGKVIGTYVSPVIMLKRATRLTNYAGKLSEAVAAVKHDFGCASFAAGTLVLTAQGPLPIEHIAIGQQVQSRNERSYADRPQAVTRTFGRIAPSYRLLQTEFDTFKLTDEHPLWVQGKGWTEARSITDDDVIAGQHGDALVLRNDAVALPLQVYNFSVAGTESYFVGAGGVWAHNAKCSISISTTGAAKKFEELISKMGPSERVGIVRVQLAEIADARGFKKRRDLTAKNSRDVYQDIDGNFFAVDSQHGRFEKTNKRGKHMGEFDIEFNFIENSIDRSGRHDLVI
jgi:hypothetical protein